MNCGMKDEMLLAWVDGDLDQAGRARVSEHIVGCVDCHRTIGELKDVTGALEKWGAPEPEALPTARELLDRAGVPPSAAPGSIGWRDLVRRYGAVAGIVLFATVAGLVVLPRYTSPDKAIVSTAVPEETPATAQDKSRQSTTRDDAAAPPAGTVPATPEAAAPPSADKAVTQEQDGDAAATGGGTAASGLVPADGAVSGEVVSPAEERVDDPAPPPPGAAPNQPAAEPVTTETSRDLAKAGKEDSNAAVGRSAASAPKPAARAAGRRESESAVVRRADVTMAGAEASDVADRVAAAARAENGSVTKRWSRAKDNGGDTVTVEISVPADHFEQTISRLRGVGNVQSVRRSAIDLSGRIAEIDDELSDERKNEDASVASKKQKTTSKDSLQRERRGLEARAERAIITVTIVGKP